MFNHSVRVPRNYKIAANIVQKVSEEGGSVKTLLYDDKLKHFRIDVLYALVNETIKHAIDIEKMFECTGILVNEPRLQPWLAKVLTAELVYGKKALPGNSKPEQTILSYKEQFLKLIPDTQHGDKSKVRRPRYVRVNTNLLTTSDAIRAFRDDGYKFIRCTSGSYNDYLEQIQKLAEYDFTQDYHVKTIFVFSPRVKLREHDFYMENKIIFQDKATSLAVHLLAPEPGSVVLDLCAAPGMKTTQLAAYLRNEGKIYAVERDEKRYATLCKFVEATGSKCVETLHKDSLEIRRGDLDDVEYILLDPSCSGSGMDLSVHSYVEETRLAKLTSLQEKFLKHAMNSFPNAKRIVYSTCSIFPEENERVVTNIVKASRAKWRVKDVREPLKNQWNNFGSGMYGSMGTRCLYAKPDSDFTTGFFLAVLDRDLKDGEQQQDDNKFTNGRKIKENKLKDTVEELIDENEIITEKHQEKLEMKKKHRDSESHNIEDAPYPEYVNDENVVPKSKKKKRNKDIEMSTHNDDQMVGIPEKNIDIANIKKKKRKSKLKDERDETIKDVNTESVDKYTIKEELNDFRTDAINVKKKKKIKCLDELENSETSISFGHTDEVEKPKKKKKKQKESESGSVMVLDVDIPTNVENKNIPENSEPIENNEKLEMPKKKKKKRKGLENEPREADIYMVNENNNTSENIDSQFENIGKERPKKIKKKRKEYENEVIEDVTDISLNMQQEKSYKKAKKKKKTAY